MHSHQMTAIAIGGRALLIDGSPGSGKSSLALALIDRGATLIGDDGVIFEAHGTILVASPHPNTRGLLEVRNLGLVPLPVCDQAPAGLVIRLTPGVPRFIEVADQISLYGVALPLVRLEAFSANLALKAELALETFGIGLH